MVVALHYYCIIVVLYSYTIVTLHCCMICANYTLLFHDCCITLLLHDCCITLLSYDCFITSSHDWCITLSLHDFAMTLLLDFCSKLLLNDSLIEKDHLGDCSPRRDCCLNY